MDHGLDKTPAMAARTVLAIQTLFLVMLFVSESLLDMSGSCVDAEVIVLGDSSSRSGNALIFRRKRC
jgi:hypothetical protein